LLGEESREVDIGDCCESSESEAEVSRDGVVHGEEDWLKVSLEDV
jgi:hypothetical protein